MRAELQGIIEGMRLTWDKDIRKLCIQTDSKAAISLIRDVGNLEHRHASQGRN
ncbi:hypothetical protein LINPERPRIM_LOCUS41016 [Linum perenne]